jgi:hypothetical protein
MPYSILRFAQLPSAAPGTVPVSLNWDVLRDYTTFFFTECVSRFRSDLGSRGFSQESFLRAVASDLDCTACILTPTARETKHVKEFLR